MGEIVDGLGDEHRRHEIRAREPPLQINLKNKKEIDIKIEENPQEKLKIQAKR